MQAAGSKKVYKGVRQEIIIVDFTITVTITVIIVFLTKVWDAYKTIGRNEGMMNGLYRGEGSPLPFNNNNIILRENNVRS